jgi:hypothetical protein
MAGNRAWPCGVALLAATLTLLAGGLALYARHAILDERAFADRAVGTLAQDEVRDELVDRISQRIVDAHPELADQRPELDAAAGDAVRSPEFAAEFHTGAAALHRELFADDAHVARLVVPGTGASLRADFLARVRTSSPRRAVRPSALPPSDPELMALGGGRLESGLRDAAPWGRRLAALWPFALLAAALLLALGVRLAPVRRRGLRRAALAVAVAAGAVVAATTVAKALLLSTFDTSHGDAVVGTIWNAYLRDLRMWGLAVGACALVVAALADPGTRGAWRRALAAPQGAGIRLARAAGLVAVAALLVAAPEVPLDLALVAAAGALVFSAAAEVARLTADATLRGRGRPAD